MILHDFLYASIFAEMQSFGVGYTVRYLRGARVNNYHGSCKNNFHHRDANKIMTCDKTASAVKYML